MIHISYALTSRRTFAAFVLLVPAARRHGRVLVEGNVVAGVHLMRTQVCIFPQNSFISLAMAIWSSYFK